MLLTFHKSPVHSRRTELNCSALQPISFVKLTRVTNHASCNWVNWVRVTSVQFSSSAVNADLSVTFVLMLLTTVITIVIVLTGNASRTSSSTETEAASALAQGRKNFSHATVL